MCYAVFNKSESDNETNLEKDVSHKDVREQNVYEEETIHVTQKQPMMTLTYMLLRMKLLQSKHWKFL